MHKRPTSVSVIAWILIVMAGISLISTTVVINTPEMHRIMAKSSTPIPVQYAMSYIGLLITMVSGIAMLKGMNWARYVYVIWGVFGFIVGMVTSPMKVAMIPGVIMFLACAFFLFRPKATAFFYLG